MIISPKNKAVELDSNAVGVVTDDTMLRVALADGREIATPLEFFPRLRDATPDQRNDFVILGGGYGIAWDSIDEHISVPGLLRRR